MGLYLLYPPPKKNILDVPWELVKTTFIAPNMSTFFLNLHSMNFENLKSSRS
jgi:hypothetical protein